MTENKLIGLRLQSFIDDLGHTQSAVSKLLAVEQGYFNQIIKGHKKISSTIILRLAKRFTQLNLRWLLTGEGSMYGLETIYEHPPPELPAGDHPPDQVQEPAVKIQYLNKCDLQSRIEDQERRIIEIERLLKSK